MIDPFLSFIVRNRAKGWKGFHFLWISLFFFSVFSASLQSGPVLPATNSPFVFIDEKIAILPDLPLDAVEAEITVLGAQGWKKPQKILLSFEQGRAEIQPLKEGLHRLRFGGSEIRFLGMENPPPLTEGVLLKTLPRRGGNLFRQEPYTILAMGDSVTATGDYARMLAKMLEHAAGNRHIRVEIRAHAGKSVDASVRNWNKDVKGLDPDLVLIMYGLNDQAASSPLESALVWGGSPGAQGRVALPHPG